MYLYKASITSINSCHLKCINDLLLIIGLTFLNHAQIFKCSDSFMIPAVKINIFKIKHDLIILFYLYNFKI